VKFSIITPVLNSEKTIHDTLHSIRFQKCSDWENIIIDGGSQDKTLDFVRAGADERTKIFCGKDKGIFDAINKGISRARGDIIAVLHSDDQYENDQVLNRVSEEFAQSSVSCVYGDLVYVFRNNPSRIFRHWVSGEFERNHLRTAWKIPHPTLFVRKEIYEQYGNYDIDLTISADYELCLRLFWQGQLKPAYIPEVLVRMKRGGVSNKNPMTMWKAHSQDYLAIQRHMNKPPHLMSFSFSKIGRRIPQFFKTFSRV